MIGAHVRPAATEGDHVGIEENKDLIRSFYGAGDAGDVETAMSLLSDQISWTNIGSSRGLAAP